MHTLVIVLFVLALGVQVVAVVLLSGPIGKEVMPGVYEIGGDERKRAWASRLTIVGLILATVEAMVDGAPVGP